jgi:riboflavin kinase/FMN adenylyltransferase
MTASLPMRVEARVIRGKGRGRGLGYPTLNLEIPPAFALPHGIYACRVFVDGVSHAGAAHFGPIPVFDELEPSLEVHLLDTSLGRAPAAVSLEVVRRLRDVRGFPSAAELAAQIALDVENARRALDEEDGRTR